MSNKPGTKGYENVLTDESLAIFLRKMTQFDQRFCDHMIAGDDFTLRLEIHGDAGKMCHCRVHSDSFERPSEAKGRKKNGGSGGH